MNEVLDDRVYAVANMLKGTREKDHTMSKEQMLRWLADFGSDYVSLKDLAFSWANEELKWNDCARNGYLDRKMHRTAYKYKLNMDRFTKMMNEE